jgi:hypothetical protein
MYDGIQAVPVDDALLDNVFGGQELILPDLSHFMD